MKEIVITYYVYIIIQKKIFVTILRPSRLGFCPRLATDEFWTFFRKLIAQKVRKFFTFSKIVAKILFEKRLKTRFFTPKSNFSNSPSVILRRRYFHEFSRAGAPSRTRVRVGVWRMNLNMNERALRYEYHGLGILRLSRLDGFRLLTDVRPVLHLSLSG